MRRLARQLAPWLLAAAILVALFWQVPAVDAWRAVRDARLSIFLPAVLAAVFFWWALESAAFAFLFTRFNAPLSWAEARSLRGVTYLLTPINWNAGTAGIVLHLRRSKQIGALDSTSSMLFYGAMDGLVLSGLVLLGVWLFPDSPEIASVRNVAAGAVVVIAVSLAVFMTPAPDWSWLGRLRGLRVFRTHGLATLRDVAVLGALRLLYFAGFVGLFWLGNHAFGVPVPLAVTTASMPAVLVVAGLPVTPAGLGTQQAAMLFFWSPYGEPAAVLAFGLAFPVAITAARCLLGLCFLRDLAAMRTATRAPA